MANSTGNTPASEPGKTPTQEPAFVTLQWPGIDWTPIYRALTDVKSAWDRLSPLEAQGSQGITNREVKEALKTFSRVGAEFSTKLAQGELGRMTEADRDILPIQILVFRGIQAFVPPHDGLFGAPFVINEGYKDIGALLRVYKIALDRITTASTGGATREQQ